MLMRDIPAPKWIDSPEVMLQVCRRIKDTKECGIDTETTGKDDLMRDNVIVWSLCPSLTERYCISRNMLPIFSRELGGNPNIDWIMTNANFDNNILENSGVPLLKGNIHCTLVLDALWDENERHGLKETALRHCGLQMTPFKQVFNKKAKETYQDTLLRYLKEDPDSLYDYASLDAYATLKVYKFLKKSLDSETLYNDISLWDYYYKLEMPFIKILYKLMRRGVMVDLWYLRSIREPIVIEMENLNKKINKIAGKEINLNSPTQMVDLFINRLGHKAAKFTSGGKSGNRQPSVDEEVLTKWASEGCEASKILVRYRGLAKTLGTYVDGMISRVDERYRIHPMLTQSVAVTGRTSSKNPNLQNIPRASSDEWFLRGAFIPKDGYVMICADYEQLEMRILSHVSGDENMRNVIRKGWDIHSGTASLMYGVPYEDIQKAKKELSKLEKEKVPRSEWPEWATTLVSHRQDSKTIGFGIVYEQGDKALAKSLNISTREAGAKKEKFFEPFPMVKQYIEDCHHQCRNNFNVHTILGRLRRLKNSDADWKPARYDYRTRNWIPETPGPLAARDLRMGTNFGIQGSAAELVKLAQIMCEKDAVLANLGVEQILQVHDEIMFEVPSENVKEAVARIKSIMSKPYKEVPERFGLDFDELSIPLDVDVGIGDSWMEAH